MGFWERLFGKRSPDQLTVLSEENKELRVLLHEQQQQTKHLQTEMTKLQERLFIHFDKTNATATTHLMKANPEDLTPRQKQCLTAIGEGALSSKQVGEIIKLNRQQTSTHLSKMVRANVIERLGVGRFQKYQARKF